MKRARFVSSRRRYDGFTLMECIIVIVILAIAAVGISSIQARIYNGQSSIKNLQVGTQLMQECAEQALGTRLFNTNWYEAAFDQDGSGHTTSFGTNLCNGVPALTGYTIPTVTIADQTGSICPADAICKSVSITQGGLSAVTVLLVGF
jgi:prepilin-type N-terminal cleavage/methylation domain-containing protein